MALTISSSRWEFPDGPHHSRDMAEGTLRAILREAGIDIEDFLGQ